MRKRNLKLTLNIHPSQIYVQVIVTVHTLATITSVCMPFEGYVHLLGIGAIALSLCYQLNLYSAHSRVVQICFEGQSVHIKHRQCSRRLQDEFGELLPTVWILPGLCVLYFQLSSQKRMLPIFADAISQDDLRRLRVFALRGPLLLRDDKEKKTHAQR
jgi:hypothetical protein